MVQAWDGLSWDTARLGKEVATVAKALGDQGPDKGFTCGTERNGWGLDMLWRERGRGYRGSEQRLFLSG